MTTTTVPTDPEAAAIEAQSEDLASSEKQSPEMRLALLEKHDHENRRICERIAELRMRHAGESAQAKETKKALDASYEQLYEHGMTKATIGPLFDATEDEWRSITVNELIDHGAKMNTVKLLTDLKPKAIHTLGNLADYLDDQYRKLTDIDGIGDKAAETIEDALTAWFSANPDKCPPIKSDSDELTGAA